MNSADIEVANQSIAKQVAETLNKHYPNHLWAVNANVENGLVDVLNFSLSGKWGYRMKIDDMATDPTMRLTIRAGGELLERYNLSRGAAKQHELDNLKHDFKGEAIQA